MPNGYPALIRRLSEDLFSDLVSGGSAARAKVAEALDRLPGLLADGELDAQLVAALNGALADGPPAPVRFPSARSTSPPRA